MCARPNMSACHPNIPHALIISGKKKFIKDKNKILLGVSDDKCVAKYYLCEAKREFQNTLEVQFNEADARRLRQDLNPIMGYKRKLDMISGINTG